MSIATGFSPWIKVRIEKRALAQNEIV